MDPDRTRYERIGYADELETAAFKCLSQLDIDGCRSALGQLAGKLRCDPEGGEVRHLTGLMLDLLLTLNRRVHRILDNDAAYVNSRLRVIDQLSGCRALPEARQRFMETMNDLLAPLSTAPPDGHPLISRARAYIDANYRNRIYLSTVARHLNVSPNYLSRLFRSQVGTTLTAYVQSLRLDHARCLLATAEHSISEIAYQVGYQNYRDFYRNFVKREKASPREVRRRLASRSA